ncbi:MAG: SMP-30/gluconolactonase/LRE family protein [Pseudomonadota bacterium]
MIDIDDIKPVGSSLQRPECVLAAANGRVYTSDWRGGVTVIEPDGQQWSLLANESTFKVKPNGITLMADGSLLLCHLGDETGGVYKLDERGELSPFLLEVDGAPLPPTNFAHLDIHGRVWVTVSTRLLPRARGYNSENADGFIILIDDAGARIVADRLGYTNECVVHPDGSRLFVNETFARKLTAFDIADDGRLSNRNTIIEFGEGTFPDGLVFDEDGAAWITSIVSNRVIRVSSDGKQEIIVEDCDKEHLEWVEQAYTEGGMGRPHLDGVKSKHLRNISSLAFGGPSLNVAYMGCLLGNSIYRFSSPVKGHPPSHWNFNGPKNHNIKEQ